MPHLKKTAFSPVRDGTDDVPEDDGTGTYRFTLPADVDGDFSSRGHLPLLWLLVPLVLVFAVCFTFDWHAPVLGLVLLVAGGGASVPLAWRCPSAVGLWRVCFLTGVSGFALLLFAARVPPLPDWSGLPPREAELTVRWEQVFNSKPDAKTVGGVARVIAAPALLPELVGNDIYCQVRRPVPSALAGRGAVFTVTGVLDTARRQVSRGEDDGFLRYLEKRRATMALSRGRAGAVVEPAPPFQAWCSRQSVRIEGVLRRGLEAHPDEADLFTAILLGKTSGLSKEARTMFARTGTTHLFSVSGLHVGVIAAVLFWLGQWVRFPNTGWRVFVIAVMFVFVMITGGSAAALRAWLMVSCMLAARFVDRRSSPASGLVLAACGVLLWEPRLLLDVGFQLSYGIVAALVFYGLPLARWARARWRPWALLPEADLGWWRQAALRGWGSLLDSAGIGAAATVAGAPLVVSHFSLFSAGSLLANLVVVPLSFPVMCVGFFSLALGVSGLGVLAVPLNWIAGINLALLGAVVRFFSGLPGMAWALEYRVAWAGPVTALVLLGVFLAVPFGEVADDGRIRGWLFWVPPVIVAFSFLLAAG